MINFVYYSENNKIKKLDDPTKVKKLLKNKKNSLWIDILNPDSNDIKFLTENFNFHSLALEDVMHRRQRPKIDDYDSYLFMVLRPIDKDKIRSVELDMFLGKNYVVTARKRQMDNVDKVVELFKKGNILNKGVDFLAYHLIDRAIDSYFPALDTIENKIDRLEDLVILEPKPEIIDELHTLKKVVFILRKLITANRELIGKLSRRGSPFIKPKTLIFLRDVYDHCFRQNDMIDTYRELISDTREIYLSQISNKLNQTMQTLTAIATITLPLAVIVGIYGMNFRFMPELEWRYGYFVVLAILLILAISMFYYFRRKGWI